MEKLYLDDIKDNYLEKNKNIFFNMDTFNMKSNIFDENRLFSLKKDKELIADRKLSIEKMESPSLLPPTMMAMAPPSQPSPMPM